MRAVRPKKGAELAADQQQLPPPPPQHPTSVATSAAAPAQSIEELIAAEVGVDDAENWVDFDLLRAIREEEGDDDDYLPASWSIGVAGSADAQGKGRGKGCWRRVCSFLGGVLGKDSLSAEWAEDAAVTRAHWEVRK
ncbi:hypothetical protein HK102_007545 [Quaeritorhiza haematococci]|nr:hypothetical protein HK102_007545 [Quaeritorhiza haematococci]